MEQGTGIGEVTLQQVTGKIEGSLSGRELEDVSIFVTVTVTNIVPPVPHPLPLSIMGEGLRYRTTHCKALNRGKNKQITGRTGMTR